MVRVKGHTYMLSPSVNIPNPEPLCASIADILTVVDQTTTGHSHSLSQSERKSATHKLKLYNEQLNIITIIMIYLLENHYMYQCINVHLKISKVPTNQRSKMDLTFDPDQI